MTTLTFQEGEWRVRLVAESNRLLEVHVALRSDRGADRLFSHSLLRRSQERLRRYFQEGEPLGGVPLSWECQSPFQKKVLRCVQKIPFGQTRSYGWLAKQIGRPGAARACGQALRKNRFLLFIPCHRVVGRSGLGGFSCGVRLKKRLLSHERAFSERN